MNCQGAPNKFCPLRLTKEPVYETRDLFAENKSLLVANSAIFGFGNGDYGALGLPFDSGWELIEIGLHADSLNMSPSERLSVEMVAYNNDGTYASIGMVELVSDTDGGGTTHHAYKYIALDPVPAIPAHKVIGFRTLATGGGAKDVRVHARTRRQVGERVTSICWS